MSGNFTVPQELSPSIQWVISVPGLASILTNFAPASWWRDSLPSHTAEWSVCYLMLLCVYYLLSVCALSCFLFITLDCRFWFVSDSDESLHLKYWKFCVWFDWLVDSSCRVLQGDDDELSTGFHLNAPGAGIAVASSFALKFWSQQFLDVGWRKD